MKVIAGIAVCLMILGCATYGKNDPQYKYYSHIQITTIPPTQPHIVLGVVQYRAKTLFGGQANFAGLNTMLQKTAWQNFGSKVSAVVGVTYQDIQEGFKCVGTMAQGTAIQYK